MMSKQNKLNMALAQAKRVEAALRKGDTLHAHFIAHDLFDTMQELVLDPAYEDYLDPYKLVAEDDSLADVLSEDSPRAQETS